MLDENKHTLLTWLCLSFDVDQQQLFFDVILAESESAAQKRVQSARSYATVVNVLSRDAAISFMRELVDSVSRDSAVDSVDYLLSTAAEDPRDAENESVFVKTDTGRWELKNR